LADALVSVVVPVFAGERFLGDALDSVAAQTYPRTETIVVDDGSPDGSAQIAAARPGVRVLRERHRGVAAARNAGVSAVRGELIAFLDQDDEWQPHKLARQTAVLAERPELAIACDSDWLTRARDHGLASEMLADVLVRWRVHGANGSYDQATMRSEMFRMLRATTARQREAARVG
jgi:glycosyltransferase involved in cell wall biosynthesis